MRKKWCGAFFLLILLPLCSESLRDQNKTYFNSIQWEELNDLAIPPVPEPYTIEGGRPIPYADTIDDGDVFPSLPQLGVLDYQNIPEDLLTFCDTVTAAIVAKSVDSSFFSTQKAFLPYFGRFMFEHFPDFSYAFYGRPSFKQDGSAIVLLRLAVKTATAVQVPDENQATALQQDTAAENTIAEQPENIFDVPHFFSDNEQPLFIMLELGVLKEDNAWKISYLDFKGAEYEGSALSD